MNNRARANALLSVTILLFLASSASALEWPVAEVKIRSLFGQRDESRIGRGVILDDADIVRAAGNGTRVVTVSGGRNMAGFPSTLGNAVIIAHDDGLMTVYGNLESPERFTAHDAIETGNILGKAGSSGWATPGDLLFQVLDLERKTVLNPSLVLPARADSRGPAIRNVVAVSPSGQPSVLGSAKYVRQGQYRVYAEVTDTIDGSNAALAPFRVSVVVNGSEAIAVPFEVLRAEGGKLFLDSPELTAANFYGDPERMYLGSVTLNRGRADIAIIARDSNGNERSVQFSLQIE